MRISTFNLPNFKYGFTAVAIPKNVVIHDLGSVEESADEQRIVMFGGCTEGGYSGDCSGEIEIFIPNICQY